MKRWVVKDLDQCDSICTLEYKLDEWEYESLIISFHEESSEEAMLLSFEQSESARLRGQDKLLR